MTNDDRKLGMDRQISRRDFLNGVALTGAGLGMESLGLNALAAQPAAYQPVVSPAYPPLNTGLRGSTPPALADFPDMRAGKYKAFPVAASSIAEEYDVVIVGGGISGLSAAYFYQRALGKDKKILILDNNDDFGGHAKRNQFQVGDKTLISYGGTMGIATPYPYSYMAKAVLQELGIDVTRNAELANRVLDTQYHLGQAMFFNKETFGEDRLVPGYGRTRLAEYVTKTPLSPAAQADIVRLYGKNPDYMSGKTSAQKIAALKHMSYQDYLLNVAKVSPDVIPFFKGQNWRNSKHVDTVPAYEAAEHGSVGFNGLGLELGELFSEGSFSFHFPDGNASVARLLISKIVPNAFGALQDMNTIVNATVDYTQLDVPANPIRVRLSSPVLRVIHEGLAGAETGVLIAYKNDGKLQAVRGKFCIMACWNMVTPLLIPELPEAQKKGLTYGVKVPMLYTNVVIKRWVAFQKLGVSRVSCPDMYYPSLGIDTGNNVGGYQAIGAPDEPVNVHLTRSPNKPGLPSRKDQNAAGQQELLTMSFADHERIIRDQFQRVLGPGGFSAADDIASITVNRWPYGYAYTYDTLGDPEMPEEERPHVVGRKRFGRITIANCDSGAAAFTNQAMDEANRAVQELFLLQGLR